MNLSFSQSLLVFNYVELKKLRLIVELRWIPEPYKN